MTSKTRILEVPEDILDSARITIPELKLEIAISLNSQRRLSFGKARELADLSMWVFRQALAARRVAPDNDNDDLEDDVASLRHLNQ